MVVLRWASGLWGSAQQALPVRQRCDHLSNSWVPRPCPAEVRRVVAASGAGADWDQVSLLRFTLFGSVGGVCLEVPMYPVFALVARLQFERKAHATLISGAINMVKTTPIRHFYRGFSMYALAGLPSLGIFYASYNQFKKALEPVMPAPVAYGASAVLADLAAVPFFSPVEMMAKRMQVQGDSNASYGGVRSAFRHILATEGWMGMFRGMGALFSTMAPYSAVWWITYEHVKPGLFERVYPRDACGERGFDSKPLAPLLFATGGAFAGFVAATLTNPLCVATTRLQTQHTLLESGGAASVHLDRNVFQAIRSIVMTEGASALGRGLIPRIGQCMFASAITFPIYELVMHLSMVHE